MLHKDFEKLDELGQLEEIRKHLVSKVKGLEQDNARLLTHATNAADMLTRRDEENERLRNRIAKLKSLGVVDIDAFERDIRQLDEFRFKERLHPREAMFKNIDNLKAQVDELTKHNHALSERAKRAEAHSDSIGRVIESLNDGPVSTVNITMCQGVLQSIVVDGVKVGPDCVLTMTHVPKGLPELKFILQYETCYGEDK